MNRANCDKSMKFGRKRHFAMLEKMRVGPILKIVPIPYFYTGVLVPSPHRKKQLYIYPLEEGIETKFGRDRQFDELNKISN